MAGPKEGVRGWDAGDGDRLYECGAWRMVYGAGGEIKAASDLKINRGDECDYEPRSEDRRERAGAGSTGSKEPLPVPKKQKRKTRPP